MELSRWKITATLVVRAEHPCCWGFCGHVVVNGNIEAYLSTPRTVTQEQLKRVLGYSFENIEIKHFYDFEGELGNE